MLRNMKASKKAIEKVKKAGGKVELEEGTAKEFEDKEGEQAEEKKEENKKE